MLSLCSREHQSEFGVDDDDNKKNVQKIKKRHVERAAAAAEMWNKAQASKKNENNAKYLRIVVAVTADGKWYDDVVRAVD